MNVDNSNREIERGDVSTCCYLTWFKSWDRRKVAAATKYSNANQNLAAAAADVTKLATEWKGNGSSKMKIALELELLELKEMS